MWPSFHRMRRAVSPVSATMPFHVQPCWSLEYLTRWSVMFSVALIGSTTVEGAFSFGWRLQLGWDGGAVGLVRHRKCAERGIAGSHDLDARRARRRLHLVDHFLLRTRHRILISFQDMVPVLRQLGDLHAERFEPLGNATRIPLRHRPHLGVGCARDSSVALAEELLEECVDGPFALRHLGDDHRIVGSRRLRALLGALLRPAALCEAIGS